jgi:hypothetical protein
LFFACLPQRKKEKPRFSFFVNKLKGENLRLSAFVSSLCGPPRGKKAR